MNRNRRFALRAISACAGVLVLGAVGYAIGLRVNGTESLPPGLWQVFGMEGVAERGQIVNFCPPDIEAMREARERHYLHEGPCSGDYETLFKPVIAVAGDTVMLDADGISVNGTHIANSAPTDKDGAGNRMPALTYGTYLVGIGEVWVVSSYTPWSFDSRYFGPIPTATIRGQARPLWTFDVRTP